MHRSSYLVRGDCREADSRDTSPRHACLGEVTRKIWLHDFAINNNGGSVPVIFISLVEYDPVYTIHVQYLCNMSNGHLNVHWTLFERPLDLSVRPMDEWTFECPMDISIRPMDTVMSSGHFFSSNGPLDICVCPMDIIDI